MKKKILYITINKIFENSGGGIGAKRIYTALRTISEEGTINFKVISLDNDLNESMKFKVNKSKKDDIVSRICLHSNYMYTQFNKSELIKEIKKYNPDIVFISSSRLGFVTKILKKNNIDNIVGFFDNIEYDYVDSYALKYKGIKRSIFKILEKKVVYKDEKDFIENINLSVFLTQRDRRRAEKLYTLKSEKQSIIPICVDEFNKNLNEGESVNLVFMGSLNYGSNTDAIEYFLEYIWESVYTHFENIKFIVAGGNPSEKFIEKLKNYNNVELIANFKNKEDVINEKSIFISPIRSGAGMKVKVAEALSMGLPIIGSKETLIGYEEIESEENFVFEANSKEEYIRYIEEIKNKDFKYIKVVNKKLYRKYYSGERIKKDISKIINYY